VRIFATTFVYFLVMAAFGAVPLATGLLTVPIATLTGIAFGAPLFAYAAAQREDRGQFAVVQRVLVLPLTLFSGTLFPLEQLPVFLRPIGWLSPLWHGAELGRVTSYAAERPVWMIAVHLVFLLALAVGGWRLTVRVTRKRLDA
jgi:lipooligosaccharide transport system permease protein